MTESTETNATDTSAPDGAGGGWIQTYTGRAYWPMRPRTEDVCIEDIAHALALKTRFAGHTREFYCVAQHCVLMVELARRDRACDDLCRWALMHDAAEAYLPDVARPVKKALVGFKMIKNMNLEAIAGRFNLPWPMPQGIESAIHRMDLIMLATERRDLMAGPPIPWLCIEQVAPCKQRILPWTWQESEKMFINRFIQLFDFKR